MARRVLVTLVQPEAVHQHLRDRASKYLDRPRLTFQELLLPLEIQPNEATNK